MKIFTVVGTSDTGKTSTIVEIIKELVKRDFEVNSVKSVHIDNFTIDKKGKDSWRHREAGSKVTGVVEYLDYIKTVDVTIDENGYFEANLNDVPANVVNSEFDLRIYVEGRVEAMYECTHRIIEDQHYCN